jgi:hypothetical protein
MFKSTELKKFSIPIQKVYQTDLNINKIEEKNSFSK